MTDQAWILQFFDNRFFISGFYANLTWAWAYLEELSELNTFQARKTILSST